MRKFTKPVSRRRAASREELISILIAIENVQGKLRDLSCQTCGGSGEIIEAMELRDRLRTLYACIPISDVIEFVSEASTKVKGAA